MQRRQFVILYTVLCAAVVLLTWRLVSEWKRADRRYATAPRAKAATSANVPATALRQVLPSVDNIIANNVFSPDRNNEIAQETKQGPPPPLPIVFGTMDLGTHYEALMAEGGKGGSHPFRRVKKGDLMGPYKVVEIDDDKVVVDLDGEKTNINVYQSAHSAERTETASSPAATPSAAPVVESVGAPQPQSSSTSPSSPASSRVTPAETDPGVRVTIEGNRRRFERTTPFGKQVWYEPLKK